MSNPTVTYVLVGPLTGRSIQLGDYMFVDGKFTTSTYTEEEHVLLAKFLGRWQGVRDNGISKVHTDGDEEVQSGVPTSGGTDADQAFVKVDGPTEAQGIDTAGQVVSDGNGQAEGVKHTGQRGKRARKH